MIFNFIFLILDFLYHGDFLMGIDKGQDVGENSGKLRHKTRCEKDEKLSYLEGGNSGKRARQTYIYCNCEISFVPTS